MAKKKQEQQEQSQDEHVMAILDKRTNKTAVVSKMNALCFLRAPLFLLFWQDSTHLSQINCYKKAAAKHPNECKRKPNTTRRTAANK